MKIILPPLLDAPPPPQPFFKDFSLLAKKQMRVTWNKWRHLPRKNLILMGLFLFWIVVFVGFLGSLIFGAIEEIPFELGQGLLSLIFMSGLIAQIFFGITAAFTSLYMSEDLELLFTAPVSLKAVFAAKSISVFISNFVTATIFVLVPGIFYGLLFKAGAFFYLLVVLVTMGLLAIGTALAELLNLLVMRIVPPHRSKEAVGFIAAFAGIVIALMFQIPNMMMARGDQLDIYSWLTGNAQALEIMKFFPWGWGSKALVTGMSGNVYSALGWSLLIFSTGFVLFSLAATLVERGFRRGFISLSQGEGGHRRKPKKKGKGFNDVRGSQKAGFGRLETPLLTQLFTNESAEIETKTSTFAGIWAVAKKDLLYLKRDTREWFAYLTPLIIMAFFIVQYLIGGSRGTQSSLIIIFIMYTIMFSGNMALQSFGREGESDWLLNSVPLTGWPVVWGKLLASVLPTLVLMEALLVGTGIAIGLSFTVLLALAVGAVFLSLGSSAIGLYHSINNSRFNPENPQQRIAPGASMIMYLINLIFITFLALGLVNIFRPTELILVLEQLPPITYEGGFLSALIYGLFLISRPLLWPTWAGVLTGILITGAVWSGMFFGFMAATVRESRKGFKVEIVTSKKKQPRGR